MGYEKTDPRTKLIGVIAFLVVSTLIALRFVFDWYFLDVTEKEQHSKIGGRVGATAERDTMRDQALASLEGGPIPIQQAMRQVAFGRANIDVIHVAPSEDKGALTGWGHAKGEPGRLVYVPPPPPPVELTVDTNGDGVPDAPAPTTEGAAPAAGATEAAPAVPAPAAPAAEAHGGTP